MTDTLTCGCNWDTEGVHWPCHRWDCLATFEE